VIPKIIHFVWIGIDMPEWAERNIAEFARLNPTYEVRVHGDEVLLDRWRDLYEGLSDVCTKSDLLRYSALQRFGGWYFDTDFYPFRPIDDLIRAYGLDGSKAFVAQLHGQKNPAYKASNAVLGITVDSPVWPLVNEAISQANVPVVRTAFGPKLMTDLFGRYPSLFCRAEWPWFYPARAGRAGRLYGVCQRGHSAYMRRVAPTGGQIPFAIHLWAAGGRTITTKSRELIDELPGGDGGPWNGVRVCMAVLPMQWQDGSQCFRAVAGGLARIGCTVEVRDIHEDNLLETTDLLVVWNGRKGHYKRVSDLARTMGIPRLVLENGFFDRDAYTQIDHVDILHWASWADKLPEPASAEGAERLARVWPRPLEPFGQRDGYVLVLGQVRGDVQMQDSEISVATPLAKVVARSLRGTGVEGRFRKHPQARTLRARCLPVCEAETLEEAIAGARFAVMINSNGGNECLAMGCPVLCLGPALYAKAGVAKQTTMRGIKRALAEMIDGWRPETDKVRNYLRWLACHQWSQEEYRSGDVLDRVLQRALSQEQRHE